MIKSYLKLHGSTLEEVLNGNRPTLTAKQFFGKEEGQSYFEQPEQFITFAKGLRPKEVAHLDRVISDMRLGRRVTNVTEAKDDKGGRQYLMVTMTRGNADVQSKFILEGPMVQFLDDYMDAKFIAGFTLEELIEEAMNY